MGFANSETLQTTVRSHTLSDILRRTRFRFPQKTALSFRNNRLTYEQLDIIVDKTACALVKNGITPGQMAAVLSKNSLDFVIVNFALARIGAVMVPINYMLSISEVSYILGHAGISVLFASPAYAETLDHAAKEAGIYIHARYLLDAPDTLEIPKYLNAWRSLQQESTHTEIKPLNIPIQNQSLAQVLYTSGTESRPKGVMLSHEGLLSEYVSTLLEGHMSSDDIFIHALPLYHSAQLHCFLGPGIYIGARGIILEQASPTEIIETIEREKATQLFCPPTVWIGLLRHPSFKTADLSSLQKCYYGAAIMPIEVLKELSQRLPQAEFWNFYGQTEVAPLATVLQPQDQLRKLGSAGKPALNVMTQIVDEHDNPVGPNTIGEIVHRTPHAMLGYLHDPEKTAEAFRNGWFHSGDLGVMDEEGYITIVDRKKDMIKSGGVNVSSREVEEIIYQVPGVGEVAVIGVPDAYWIEAVTAIIVPKTDAKLEVETVLKFCENHLAKFKIPKKIIFVTELPKNPSGKILKRELRMHYQNHQLHTT